MLGLSIPVITLEYMTKRLDHIYINGLIVFVMRSCLHYKGAL